jgi:hypothetical protein
MRKILISAVCFCLLLVGLNAHADNVTRRDPGDAFPWGAEIPFPWIGIQGTWATIIDSEMVYFSFSTVRAGKGLNQLQVREFDAAKCHLLAKGAGYEENRIVKALMIGPNGAAFNLAVHVFRQEDLKKSAGPFVVDSYKTVTVMNVTPLTNDTDRVTFQLYKMSTSPKAACACPPEGAASGTKARCRLN